MSGLQCWKNLRVRNVAFHTRKSKSAEASTSVIISFSSTLGKTPSGLSRNSVHQLGHTPTHVY